MTEKSFEETIEDQHKMKWKAALVWIFAGVIAIFNFELLNGLYMPGQPIPRRAWFPLCEVRWLDIFVESLIVLLIAGAAWHFRGEQRDDLYTEIIGKSTFALEHFQDRIGEEIERRGREKEKRDAAPVSVAQSLLPKAWREDAGENKNETS